MGRGSGQASCACTIPVRADTRPTAPFPLLVFLPPPPTWPHSAKGASSRSSDQWPGNRAPHEFHCPERVEYRDPTGHGLVGRRIPSPLGWAEEWPALRASGLGCRRWRRRFRVPAMLPASQHDSPTGAARPGRTPSASGSRPRRRTGWKSPSRGNERFTHQGRTGKEKNREELLAGPVLTLFWKP